MRAVGVVGRARPQVVVAVGGYASLAGAAGRPGPPGAPGAGQRGRRARGGQPAARPVRPGQCRGVGREPAAPGGGDRDAGPTRDRRRRSRRRRPGRPPGPSSGCPTDRSVVAVFGGSLGARQINRAVDGAGRAVGRPGRPAIYHIVGRRDWAAYAVGPAVGTRRR